MHCVVDVQTLPFSAVEAGCKLWWAVRHGIVGHETTRGQSNFLLQHLCNLSGFAGLLSVLVSESTSGNQYHAKTRGPMRKKLQMVPKNLQIVAPSYSHLKMACGSSQTPRNLPGNPTGNHRKAFPQIQKKKLASKTVLRDWRVGRCPSQKCVDSLIVLLKSLGVSRTRGPPHSL